MTYAILTPSFAGDFDRCRLLAESVATMVRNSEHYILVDPIDLARFAPLREFGAKIIDARELMDPTFYRLPKTRVYLTREKRLVHGWLTQQMRKMAFTNISPYENVLCVDSDIVFIRDFDPSSLHSNEKTPLFEIDWFNDENLKWANQSRQLLGLPMSNETKGYVHPTFWRRTIMTKLLAKLEEIGDISWQTSISRFRSFSEYILYGTFVREHLGLDQGNVFAFNEPLMHLSWEYDLSKREDLAIFLSTTSSDHVAIMFHSKDRVPIREYEGDVRKLWKSA